MSRANIIALLVLLLVCFAFINLDSRLAREVQLNVLETVSPLLSSGSELQQRVDAMGEGIETLTELEQENQLLREMKGQLEIENRMLADLKEENDRLRAMLNYVERSLFDLVPAQVLKRDPRHFLKFLMVGRGSNSGIEPNMPVLVPEGVLGKTISVTEETCQVLLITDPSCQIAARVAGTQEHGMISGSLEEVDGEKMLKLDFISRDARLAPGQKVVTSGLGGIYPPGIPIGAILSYEQDPIHGQAVVKPAVVITGIENVFIVKGLKK